MTLPNLAFRVASVLILATTLLAPLGCGGCREEGPAPLKAPADPAVVRVGSPEGRFVGSEACSECHQEQYAKWTASRHRSTLRVVDRPDRLSLAGRSFERGFAVDTDGTVRGPDEAGGEVRARAAYVVGGRHREDLLVRFEDGRLQVFPFSFDLDADAPFEPTAELAGGHPPPPDVIEFWTRLGRNADLACYGCHATGPMVRAAGRELPLDAVPQSVWSEAGVGCEVCHGPGGPHVDAAREPRSRAADLAMTTTDHAEDRLAICASCHGLRQTLRSPLAAKPAHVAGAPMWTFADPVLEMPSSIEFKAPFFPDLRPATYQQEAIALGESACARRGGLTCEACHDPHASTLTPEAAAADGGATICLGCHESLRGAELAHTGHAAGGPGGRCFDCHMAPLLRGPGRETARDHTLAPPTARAGEVPTACAVCHAGDERAPRIIAAWNAREPGAASRRRLEIRAAFEAVEGSKTDAAARLTAIIVNPAESWFIRWAALTHLGPAARLPGARPDPRPVRAALADSNVAVRRAAIRALGVIGDGSDLASLGRLAGDADASIAVEAVSALGSLGDPLYGARVASLAARADQTGDNRAALMLGRAALLARDDARAEAALRRALEVNPFLPTAVNDLGVVWDNLGRTEDARRAWHRALALSPRFEAARRNLED